MKNLILTIILSALAMSAVATTWFPDEATDPISGETVEVQSIGSYGSYIYDWDSKYDAVYWPLTVEPFIHFNPSSGYIAFGSDFEEISTNEIAKVKAYLSEHYDPENPPQSHLEKLLWLEKIYAQRNTDASFFIRHSCLLSYLHRKDKAQSNRYRKTALGKIDEYLKTAEPSFYRSQLYIVAGFYSKLLGNDAAAEKYWASPERLEFDEETNEHSRAYLEDILSSIKSNAFEEQYYDLKKPETESSAKPATLEDVYRALDSALSTDQQEQ